MVTRDYVLRAPAQAETIYLDFKVHTSDLLSSAHEACRTLTLTSYLNLRNNHALWVSIPETLPLFF